MKLFTGAAMPAVMPDPTHEPVGWTCQDCRRKKLSADERDAEGRAPRFRPSFCAPDMVRCSSCPSPCVPMKAAMDGTMGKKANMIARLKPIARVAHAPSGNCTLTSFCHPVAPDMSGALDRFRKHAAQAFYGGAGTEGHGGEDQHRQHDRDIAHAKQT